jgi:replicative DNA helicase
MLEAPFLHATDVLDNCRADILTGKPPALFPAGAGELARLEIGPGLVTLLGGAPGAGKTALSTQLVTDALRATPALRAVVCNVEMSPTALLDRQIARLSGVDLTLIRHRRLGAEHADRIDLALNTLGPLAERLAFVRPPFGLAGVAKAADAFRADLLLLDYIQRIAPPGEHGDKRGAVNATMDILRQFADNGVAVVVVSAVGRSKDDKGRSSYGGGGLSLASFRESSELEFGADDAYILVPDGDDDRGDAVTLRHLKSRHGECRDIPLTFRRRHQHFAAAAGDQGPRPDAGKTMADIAALWKRTAAAGDDAEGGDDGD